MDLFLSTRCPQCGADISFEEESTVIHCNYCGSALHITGRSGVMRTYVAPQKDVKRIKKALRAAMKQGDAKRALVSEKKLFFAPYWRVKGMVFRWIFGKNVRGETIKELKTKQLDHSFPAYVGINLGLRSLGIRPGALKLLFFDPSEMSKMGSIMKLVVTYNDAVRHGASLTEVGLDETGIHTHLEVTRLIGERYTLVYFPFWMIKLSVGQESRILILDAVANTVTRTLTQEQWEEMVAEVAQQPVRISFDKVSFIPFNCPNCGWQLPLNRFNIIHLCGTCKRAWMERAGRFKPIGFEVAAPPKGLSQDLVYLPFWVFQAEITSNGQSLKTMADLQGFSLLFPTRTGQNTDERLIQFYVPAAAIRNISAANKLATSVTQNQPVLDHMPKDEFSDFKLMGAFLPPMAARGMADILLCALTPRNNRNRQRFVQEADILISNMHLLWWPFYEQRLFLRDAVCGCGIQKGTVCMDG
jgi:DNA-directed RNA polymerase subunit RPC12/RpoP/predicted Zn-ribbon and HTH transcriptional regulator